jgi:hypothetical protein
MLGVDLGDTPIGNSSRVGSVGYMDVLLPQDGEHALAVHSQQSTRISRPEREVLGKKARARYRPVHTWRTLEVTLLVFVQRASCNRARFKTRRESRGRHDRQENSSW